MNEFNDFISNFIYLIYDEDKFVIFIYDDGLILYGIIVDLL